jgi:hypothetical protein
MNDTKKSSHGGKRDGAGRKSIKKKLGLDSLLSEAVTGDEWIEIFSAMKSRAKRGDVAATKLMMAYTFGEPDKSIEINGSEERPIIIKIIRASTVKPDSQ